MTCDFEKSHRCTKANTPETVLTNSLTVAPKLLPTTTEITNVNRFGAKRNCLNWPKDSVDLLMTWFVCALKLLGIFHNVLLDRCHDLSYVQDTRSNNKNDHHIRWPFINMFKKIARLLCL